MDWGDEGLNPIEIRVEREWEEGHLNGKVVLNSNKHRQEYDAKDRKFDGKMIHYINGGSRVQVEWVNARVSEGRQKMSMVNHPHSSTYSECQDGKYHGGIGITKTKELSRKKCYLTWREDKEKDVMVINELTWIDAYGGRAIVVCIKISFSQISFTLLS